MLYIYHHIYIALNDILGILYHPPFPKGLLHFSLTFTKYQSDFTMFQFYFNIFLRQRIVLLLEVIIQSVATIVMVSSCDKMVCYATKLENIHPR